MAGAKTRIASGDHANAVHLADTPVADALMRDYPSTLIHTSGEDVGLPAGVMGNSEVGQQNIVAGRIVDQEVMRITRAIRGGSFFDNVVLQGALAHVQASGGTLHVLGLLSECRDTSPRGGLEYVGKIEQALQQAGLGRVASVIGRFYAMDRDLRWERVETAYRMMTQDAPQTASSATAAIESPRTTHTSNSTRADQFLNAHRPAQPTQR